ncbi:MULTISPECIES: PRTRC system ThiF family protein [unclassified Rhodanobacter]|uniref:PRTRC system ThiF family protein n=1 Tax=unclassified Rhodanobacter TaxID=2621553 RepID=UPI0034E5609B
MGSFTIPASLVGGTRRPRVMIVGVGGTGSHFAEAFARLQHTVMALGHPGFEVTLVDGDRVSQSNVGRQRFYASDTGLSKALCLVHRINMAFGFDWEASHGYFKPKSLGDVRTPDLLVTCTDKALLRAEIGSHMAKRPSEALWADFGNGAAKGQVCLGHLGKPAASERLPNVFDLYPELSQMERADREEPSCSMAEAITRQEFPINQQVAQLGIALLWTLLRKGSLDHHGYFVETTPFVQTRPMMIDPVAWSFYGYEAPKAARRARAKRAAAG